MTHRHLGALALITATLASASSALAYEGSSVDQVWGQVTSDPYEKPHYTVTLKSLFSWGRNLILDAGQRTVSDREDLLPRFNKLVHSNGICLKGEWNVTEDSQYTGLFTKGARALIIARASTAFGDTEVGKYRGFGLAGKLYPTLNPNEVVKTANFFAIDDLTGTLTPHFLDAALTNEPALSLRPDLIKLAPIAAAVGSAFARADVNPNIRQVYELSEAGLAAGETAVTPQWMQVVGSVDQPRVDAADFRDELLVNNYPEQKFRFDISVASEKDAAGKKNWQTIGYIEFTESVVSDSCDHALHFHHPRFKGVRHSR